MKTAVEWLHSEYKRILGSVLVTPQQVIEMSDALENAKEIEKEQKGYSEEQVLEVFEHFKMHLPFHYEFLVKEHLQQFKQQEQNQL
jgi:hypothetical protein